MKPEDLFKKLKPVAGDSLDLLWQEYVLSDPKTQKMLEMALQLAVAKSFDETFEEREILLEPPAKGDAEAEYPLGFVYYGKERFYAFGLRENEWIQHVGIFGRSGGGKTNLAFLIVLELLRHGKNLLVFDWKRNYRDLLGRTDKELLLFTVGRDVSPFQFNPLIPPPSTPPAVWLKKVIEIMCHCYFLGEGVSFLLQEAMDAVYKEFGVYSGNAPRYPNLQDVRQWLRNHKTKGRETAWMESALRAVGVLCFGEVGKVFNTPKTVPLEELLRRNVILELDALTNTDKTFLIESLLLWIHHYRMGAGQREEFRHAILVEEAHHILLRKKQEITGEETVTDIILREIRELGESIILIDQHPSLISKPALGNTYCTVVMNLKHRADINMIADSLLLDTKQKRYLGKLETGWGMVKLQGRWFQPFLGWFPKVDVQKGSVSDEMVRSRMESLVIRAENEAVRLRGEREDVIRPSRAPDKAEKKGLGETETGLLGDIKDYPAAAVTERYRRLGLNAFQGNKAKASLIRRGLITTKDLATPTGRITLLLLTAQGNGLVQAPAGSPRKGGPEHLYWVERLGEHFKREGYKVEKERPIGGGKTVDLVISRQGEIIAVEIETGKSDALKNVQKCLEAGFERVFSVVLTEDDKAELEKKIVLGEGMKDEVRVILVQELAGA